MSEDRYANIGGAREGTRRQTGDYTVIDWRAPRGPRIAHQKALTHLPQRPRIAQFAWLAITEGGLMFAHLPRLLGLALACLLLAPGVGGAESGKGDSRQAPSQAGTRALPNGDFAWVKYQRHVTGQNFEEVWESSQKKMGVDARKEGYVVEAKWTGRNDAAWRSSRYNPLHVRYSHDQIEPKLLDQAKRLLELDSHSKGHGVRYAVSNLAAQRHFEQLLRKHFAKATASGQLRVWHVPGDGMK